jgi:hypothetical protein
MKSRLALRFSLVSLLGILLAGCGKHETIPSLLPLGHVDSPSSGDVIHGTARFSGWAVSESGIQSVAAYMDRHFAGFATLGMSRPDVQKAYPAIPGAAEAGWQINLPAAGHTGPHEIVLQARSKDGATRDLGTVTVTMAEP